MKSCRKTLKVIFVPVLVICIIFAFFTPFVIVGSTTIFNTIDEIQPIAHRELEISKDVNGITTIKNDDSGENVRILQLTDLHISCSFFTKERDINTVKSIVKIVQNAQPDLIVITGDMLFPFIFRSYCIDNKTMARAFISIFEKIAIPYAFTYGNHDSETLSLWNKQQLSDYFLSSDIKHSLYEPGEPMFGLGNYMIKILNNDGSINQALFLVDSGESDVKQSQIDWYEASVLSLNAEADKVVPTVVFMHIPLYEYQIAYEENSDKILYGVNNESISTMGSDCKFFDKIKECGSTLAVFCGHDHRNTWGIIYEDILLSFCPTVDYNAYLNFYEGEELIGGQIISLNSENKIEVEQMYLNNL
ncbi:MAG: metallophosphoesterase [Clostridia bacterium]|nr:metallophosphoesterase [Clostridia bacterium]MDD4685875.1 metallophosphoesterase [Clostridia bacterium]